MGLHIVPFQRAQVSDAIFIRTQEVVSASADLQDLQEHLGDLQTQKRVYVGLEICCMHF
jgi:hypothetical protein